MAEPGVEFHCTCNHQQLSHETPPHSPCQQRRCSVIVIVAFALKLYWSLSLKWIVCCVRHLSICLESCYIRIHVLPDKLLLRNTSGINQWSARRGTTMCSEAGVGTSSVWDASITWQGRRAGGRRDDFPSERNTLRSELFRWFKLSRDDAAVCYVQPGIVMRLSFIHIVQSVAFIKVQRSFLCAEGNARMAGDDTRTARWHPQFCDTSIICFPGNN
jgi:hypothetical protein